MSKPLPPLDEMGTEHEAWMEAMGRLRALGIDPNAATVDPFVDAIRYWGETLVALRRQQDEGVVALALAEARRLATEGRRWS